MRIWSPAGRRETTGGEEGWLWEHMALWLLCPELALALQSQWPPCPCYISCISSVPGSVLSVTEPGTLSRAAQEAGPRTHQGKTRGSTVALCGQLGAWLAPWLIRDGAVPAAHFPPLGARLGFLPVAPLPWAPGHSCAPRARLWLLLTLDGLPAAPQVPQAWAHPLCHPHRPGCGPGLVEEALGAVTHF